MFPVWNTMNYCGSIQNQLLISRVSRCLTNGEYLFSRCSLCYFAYLTDVNVKFTAAIIRCCKATSCTRRMAMYSIKELNEYSTVRVAMRPHDSVYQREISGPFAGQITIVFCRIYVGTSYQTGLCLHLRNKAHIELFSSPSEYYLPVLFHGNL